MKSVTTSFIEIHKDSAIVSEDSVEYILEKLNHYMKMKLLNE